MKSVARRATAIVLAAAIALVTAGCAGEPLTTREKGTLLGGGLGAATGAIVGAAVQNHEDREKQIEARLRAQQREIEQQRREIERLEQEAMLY
jgi:type II secretory pathway component PulM